jgi:predicted dehydrogenase
MVLDCAMAGVKAILCEKPMADSWGAARLMTQECQRRGVQLTFNHQRRFGAPFALARDLLRDGAIGALRRVEIGSPNDIYDTGTHWIDMCGMYAGDVPGEWVIGQIDYRTEKLIFGAHAENQALAAWRYTNGVYATIATGPGAAMVGALFRLIGTEGLIEIGVENGPLLRVRRAGSTEWEQIDTHGEGLHGPGFYERAVADTITALLDGHESELSARRALNATEIIFAVYESSRRRGRVDLPLIVTDHPLVAMIEAGDLQPRPVSN